MDDPFYRLTAEESLHRLHSSVQGLGEQEAMDRLNRYGKNVLAAKKSKTRLMVFLSQFTDVMILILFAAAGISFIAGAHTDAFVVLAIILINGWIGYSQEYHAEESMRLLKKMTAQFAMALRNGKPARIHSEEVVPGDVIILQEGDSIPADVRLIETHSLKTDEASLTGESTTVDKTTHVLKDKNRIAGDQINMAFKGTLVSHGSGKGVVTATGMETEIGKIAGMLDSGHQKTPLQQRLAVFSRQLSIAVIIICIAFFIAGLIKGLPVLQVFLTAISLAVAALPEALPAVITIALARGASRMVKQKALIRKLPAVETLGSVTCICSDKTGTLTRNHMTVEKVKAAEGRHQLLHAAMLLNNDVRFAQDGLLGDSTETALVDYVLAEKINTEDIYNAYPLVSKQPFDSQRMMMSTLHHYDNHWILFVKGAPVKVIAALSDKEHNERWLSINESWAAGGLRVLFFAYRIFNELPRADYVVEKDLEMLGAVAMIDPPREEVIDAIEECKTAGIKTIMITGDQALTAQAIGARLKITDDQNAVMTGAELSETSESDLLTLSKKILIYARVSPEQKLKIVKALQHNSEIVAMTGDGVNDAPSLKQADIGLAMGITGTDVSKEASDMILLDDNYATITRAIREGRRIYDNIRKFIIYVLSGNLSEILTILAAFMTGFAMPLLPIHILWINLVTDGLPGIALVNEPAEKNIMKRKPRPKNENLFTRRVIMRIIATGLIMTIATIYIQWFAISRGLDIRMQQTVVFTTLCFVQLGNALSVRNYYHLFFSKGFLANKGLLISILVTVLLQTLIVYSPLLQPVFKTSTVDGQMFIMISIVTVLCIIAIDSLKLLPKKRHET